MPNSTFKLVPHAGKLGGQSDKMAARQDQWKNEHVCGSGPLRPALGRRLGHFHLSAKNTSPLSPPLSSSTCHLLCYTLPTSPHISTASRLFVVCPTGEAESFPLDLLAFFFFFYLLEMAVSLVFRGLCISHRPGNVQLLLLVYCV